VLRLQKLQSVDYLETVCRGSAAIFVVHYRGMSVFEILQLKKSLKTQLVHFKVVKNTLMKIAAKNSGRNELEVALSGPVAIVYSNDVVSAAKLLNDFAKSNNKLKIVAGSVSGKFVTSEDVVTLANLPSFELIRSKLIANVQGPAKNVASLINIPAIKIARVLSEYAKKN